METTFVADRPELSRIPAGRFSLAAFCLGLAAGPIAGLIWAWLAEEAQSYVAPLVLFPLVVGVLAGLTIVATARFAQMGHRPTIVLSAALAAGVAVVGQHYFRYLSFVSHYSPAGVDTSTLKGDEPILAGAKTETVAAQVAARERGTVPFSLTRKSGQSPARKSGQSPAGQDLSALARELAPSFGEYLRGQADRGRPLLGDYVAKGWAAWLSWAVDALLTAAAAVAVTIPAFRVPYCNRCGTWYRTVRNGKIDAPTARRLADTCGVEEIAGLRSPRYRLSCCHSGCGPTYCELSWEESNGAVDLVRLWLDAEKRGQVTAILDELGEGMGDGG